MSGRKLTAGLGRGVLLLTGALIIVACVAGCITINIYFPAAAAEKAADRIIDDVLSGGKGTDAPTAPAAPAAPAK